MANSGFAAPLALPPIRIVEGNLGRQFVGHVLIVARVNASRLPMGQTGAAHSCARNSVLPHDRQRGK